MNESLSPGKEYENWKADDQYLKKLQDKPEHARLHRSEFFRYPSDCQFIEKITNEVIKEKEKLRILDIGVGGFEEPLSYLTAIQKISKQNGIKLSEAVDMEIVEVRPRKDVEIRYGLGQTSEANIGKAFFSQQQWGETKKKPINPNRYSESFELNSTINQYEFNSEIKEFIANLVDNSEKAHFNTSVENFIENDQLKQHNVVVCNNVLQHLGGKDTYISPFKKAGLSNENYETFLKTVTGIIDLVKINGILIMHTEQVIGEKNLIGNKKGKGTNEVFKMIPEIAGRFQEIGSGVYRRIK